ncbi:hypothetical protein HN460_02635 [bacterium]|nr:hypothetical protein [bacterium]MBT3795571.1 hypothetical protein [bacterium]MBT4634064.1 hypothetical protein [bacterium]
MYKIIFLFMILSTNSYSYVFRMPPKDPIPEKFDQFIFDNSLKTVIIANLKELKVINQVECEHIECKYLFISPNIVEIHKNKIIKEIALKIKN